MLKEYFSSDLSTFFNFNEFAEKHKINNEDIPIIIDHELLKERQIKCAEGTYLGDVLFHVKKSDFGEAPAIGQPVKFDGDCTMRVTDFQEDMGIYIITLGSNMS